MGNILTKLGDQVPSNSKVQQNVAMVETAEENPEIDNKYPQKKGSHSGVKGNSANLGKPAQTERELLMFQCAYMSTGRLINT